MASGDAELCLPVIPATAGIQLGNGVRRIQECLCHVLRTLFLTGFLLSPE
jgi:hypothetical protein